VGKGSKERSKTAAYREEGLLPRRESWSKKDGWKRKPVQKGNPKRKNNAGAISAGAESASSGNKGRFRGEPQREALEQRLKQIRKRSEQGLSECWSIREARSNVAGKKSRERSTALSSSKAPKRRGRIREGGQQFEGSSGKNLSLDLERTHVKGKKYFKGALWGG